jgi:hypothetical protein
MAIMAKKCFLVLGLATGMFATPAMGIDVRKGCLANKNVPLFYFVLFCSLFRSFIV